MTPHPFLTRIADVALAAPYGEVCRVMPGRLEASGPAATVGDLCYVGEAGLLAEVVAVDASGLVLVPVEDGEPAAIGTRVEAVTGGGRVGVGDGYGGRAVDALGRPIDGGLSVRPSAHVPVRGITPGALDRIAPAEMLETGVRAIDGLLTLGRGQRIGIFAASGVGKTSLVEQIVGQTPPPVASCAWSASAGARWRASGGHCRRVTTPTDRRWSPPRPTRARRCARAVCRRRCASPNTGAIAASTCCW